jgi:hypothetical protein
MGIFSNRATGGEQIASPRLQISQPTLQYSSHDIAGSSDDERVFQDVEVERREDAPNTCGFHRQRLRVSTSPVLAPAHPTHEFPDRAISFSALLSPPSISNPHDTFRPLSSNPTSPQSGISSPVPAFGVEREIPAPLRIRYQGEQVPRNADQVRSVGTEEPFGDVLASLDSAGPRTSRQKAAFDAFELRRSRAQSQCLDDSMHSLSPFKPSFMPRSPQNDGQNEDSGTEPRASSRVGPWGQELPEEPSLTGSLRDTAHSLRSHNTPIRPNSNEPGPQARKRWIYTFVAVCLVAALCALGLSIFALRRVSLVEKFDGATRYSVSASESAMTPTQVISSGSHTLESTSSWTTTASSTSQVTPSVSNTSEIGGSRTSVASSHGATHANSSHVQLSQHISTTSAAESSSSLHEHSATATTSLNSTISIENRPTISAGPVTPEAFVLDISARTTSTHLHTSVRPSASLHERSSGCPTMKDTMRDTASTDGYYSTTPPPKIDTHKLYVRHVEQPNGDSPSSPSRGHRLYK